MNKAINWIMSNPKDFFKICGVSKEKMTKEEFRKMWSFFMQDREFEILFTVLITVHHEKWGMKIE